MENFEDVEKESNEIKYSKILINIEIKIIYFKLTFKTCYIINKKTNS
jgi:hypothetical protein